METALQLVAEHGTEAVSAQLVADKIGVTQPAVFRHFPSKEAMWLAVMDWLEDQLQKIYASTEPDGRDRAALIILGQMFSGHAKLIARQSALAKLVFSDYLRLEYPAVHRRFGKLHQGYHARLVDLVERAKADDGVDSNISTEDVVTFFLAMIQGLAFQFAIARQPINLPRVAGRAIAFFLREIGAGH